MPRNGSGTFSLPAGNPVSAGTTIEASWANTTLTDIGNEITNSLSRTGAGGMLAPFRLADGSIGAPGLAFTNETATGLYRTGTNDVSFAVGGQQVMQYTVNGVAIPSGKTLTTPAVTNAGTLALSATGANVVTINTDGVERARVDASGNVGIGTSSPGASLDVRAEYPAIRSTNTGGNYAQFQHEGTNCIFDINAGSYVFRTADFTERLRLDSSGNLGLGVVPSGWATQYKAQQLGQYVSLSSDGTNGWGDVACNAYSSANNAWNYMTTGNAATRYSQRVDGTHRWYTAPSGTAGNAISFTQAMTLDASGNLLLGKTTSNDTSVGVLLQPSGYTTATRSGTTNSDTTMHVYSSGASAYRFYVGMAGTVFATSTTISAISDQRYKENIRNLDVGLNEVLALKPRVFDWKEGKGKDIKDDRGFIAQEFEQVFPDLIDEWRDPAPEGEEPYKSVRQDLIPVLVKAIQEQQAQIAALTARIEALEAA